MRRFVIAAGTALAMLPVSIKADVTAGRPDAHARELAQAVAAGEGILPRASNTAAEWEPTLKQLIEETLHVTDPAKADSIGVVVHSHLQGVDDDLAEVRVSAI